MDTLKFISDEIRQHHKLLIWAALILAVFLGWHKWVVHEDGVAHDQRVIADAQLKLTEKQNADAAVAQKSKDDAYQALLKQVGDDRRASEQKLAKLASDLEAQRQKDKTLPLPDLGARWGLLLNLPPGRFQAMPTGILASPEAVQSTVQALEELPVDRAKIEEQSNTIIRDDTALVKAGDDIQGFKNQVAGLQTQIKQGDDACTKDKEDLKRQIKKERRKGLLGWLVAASELFIRIKKF